jgi:hypothetical protein
MRPILSVLSLLALSVVAAALIPFAGFWTWEEEAKLTASDGAYNDAFGASVSIHGDTALVGAVRDDHGGLTDAGSAYVFIRSGSSWVFQAKLTAGDSQGDALFGVSVSLFGDTALIGAEEDTLNGTGAAYVFVRSGTTWSQQAKLTASDAWIHAEFGHAVHLEGDRALIGAHEHHFDGAAYVFERSGTTWSETAKLQPSDVADSDQFGCSVSLSGDTAVIGARGDDGGPTLESSGSAYVFELSGGSWGESAKLTAADPGLYAYFGDSVSISGDTALIGAWFAYNGPGLGSGAAYVFDRSGSSWTQRARLRGESSFKVDRFGQSVSLDGDLALVGAPHSGPAVSDTGTAYAFAREGSEWSQVLEFVGSDADDSANFGGAVSFDGEGALFGAVFDTSVASQSGSAFVGTVYPPPGTGYCFGDPGSGRPCPCDNDNDGSVPGSGCDNGVFASGAQLAGGGVASVSDDSLVLIATHLEPNNSGLYFQADDSVSPGRLWGDGLRCADGQLKRLQVVFADAAGTSSTTIGIAAKAGNVQAGDTKRYQCWYRTTTNPPCGLGVNDFNSTNGYEISWLP